MSNVQIPNLPVASSLSGNEELEIVQGGVSRRTTTQAIADLNPPQGTVTQIDTAGGLSGGPITTSGTIQIAGGGVDNTKLADMPAQTIKGNDGAILGPPSDITMGTLSTMLGLAPSATIDTTNANNITSGQLSDQRYYLTLSDAINRMIQLTNTPFSGAVLYLSNAGWTSLSPGIPGQVLRTQGVNNAPEWFTTTGTGTVQEVNTGTGLVGGPITTIGTIAIDVTGVTAASYGAANKTITFDVNAQGQLTTAAAVNIDIDASQTTTGVFPVVRGGTGINSYGVGDLIYGASSTTMAKLPAGTADYVLTSNGLNLPPSYKQVSLTTGVTGTLPVANGGTGATTLTGYVKGNGTSAFTANPTIPNTDITGLGTMSVQNAGSVAITGGTATLSSAALTSGTVSTAPVNATDITNKAYVDSVAEGLRTRPSARAATTANLSATYNNGASGVGATLTSTTNGAFPTIDGVSSWAVTSPPQGVLVKNQTNPAQNGRYNLTQLGDASNPWILTRCGLCDQSSEIPGSYIFVTDGTLYADTGWVLSVANPATFVIGTDAINVLQFSGAGTYLAGTGLTLTGNTFSITNTGVGAASYGTASSVPTIAVNAQGQITSASNTPIAIANTQVSGLGTMSTQNSSSVSITGGTIDGTTIGGTTAAAGTFSTLSSPSVALTGGTIDGITIGGTTPAAATFTGAVISANSSTNALRITQTGAGNALVVEDSTNPDATPFIVDATGNLLVGTTTANTNFIGSTPRAQIHSTIASSNWSSLTSYNWVAGVQGAGLNFAKSRSGTVGVQAIVQSGDNVGTMAFAADDGTSFIRAAQIDVAVDGTPGTNDMPGRLVFSTTADGASVPTERMRIDSAGNVGIGATTTANSKLSVRGSYVSSSGFAQGVYAAGLVDASTTTRAEGFLSSIGTANAAFTLPSLSHFWATQGTITGGSRTTVTSQFGFVADTTLTGATNNYGFYSNIAAGTGRWNFYANGTAANYFAGATTFNSSVAANSLSLTNALPISSGGTNATTVAGAQASLQVDPAGTAVAMAIALG